jgi:hypothetical protein
MMTALGKAVNGAEGRRKLSSASFRANCVVISEPPWDWPPPPVP